MKLPDGTKKWLTVKLAGMKIPVYLHPDFGHFGEYDETDVRIFIRDGLRHSVAVNTLIHECIHAIINDAHIHLKDQVEEQLCRAIASGLQQMIGKYITIPELPKETEDDQ